MGKKNLTAKAVVLYDCPEKKLDKAWLSESLREFYKYRDVEDIFASNSFDLIIKLRAGKLRYITELIRLSIKAIATAGSKDHIYVWNNAQACILHEICAFFHLKRNIISFLWYSPQNSKLDKIRIRCIKDPNFVALTITQKDVRRWKNKVLGANVLYFPDVCDNDNIFYPYKYKDTADRYVFSGGFTNRDWSGFLKIVRKCPDIKFKCIAFKSQWNRNWAIPSNLDVMFDTDADFYYNCMGNAYLTVTVVEENKLSGLINIIKSIQYGIIPLVTLNESTEEHYPKEYTEYLISETDDFVNKIYEVYGYSRTKYRDIINILQNDHKENFSGRNNMRRLQTDLEKIYNKVQGR